MIFIRNISFLMFFIFFYFKHCSYSLYLVLLVATILESHMLLEMVPHTLFHHLLVNSLHFILSNILYFLMFGKSIQIKFGKDCLLQISGPLEQSQITITTNLLYDNVVAVQFYNILHISSFKIYFIYLRSKRFSLTA